MEKFWNIVHFFAYKFMTKPYLFLIKKTSWIYQMDWAKRRFERMGKDPVKELTSVLTNRQVGYSSFWAYGTMIAIPFVFLFGLHNFILNALNLWMTVADKVSFFPIIFYGVISGLLNYFLLLRKDKYLKYFRKFEKQPRQWKVKWAWISAGVILFPFLVLIGSFIAMLPE